jgi:hypothetical protein
MRQVLRSLGSRLARRCRTPQKKLAETRFGPARSVIIQRARREWVLGEGFLGEVMQDPFVEGGEGVEFGGGEQVDECRRTLCTCRGAASSMAWRPAGRRQIMALRRSAGLASRTISPCSCMRRTWWASRLFSHCKRTPSSCAGIWPVECPERSAWLTDGTWDCKLTELVDATPEQDILRNQIMVVPPLNRWVSQRVALIGDSAHAMSPHITAGASLGVEDVGVLRDKLGSVVGLTAALKEYEADRLPRYRQSAVLSRAVEVTETPEDFARNYAAFSHWLLTGR